MRDYFGSSRCRWADADLERSRSTVDESSSQSASNRPDLFGSAIDALRALTRLALQVDSMKAGRPSRPCVRLLWKMPAASHGEEAARTLLGRDSLAIMIILVEYNMTRAALRKVVVS